MGYSKTWPHRLISSEGALVHTLVMLLAAEALLKQKVI